MMTYHAHFSCRLVHVFQISVDAKFGMTGPWKECSSSLAYAAGVAGPGLSGC